VRDRIFITEPDHDKLLRLIAGRRASRMDTHNLDELDQELDRAEILTADEAIPADVITMNSRVKLLDLDTGEIKVYRLVFPSDARTEDALSVLAPIGTAILGYKVGSVIEWEVPRGVRRLKVLDVVSQPEVTREASAA
jgi:regulator of nucleoside diphosphate kinase